MHHHYIDRFSYLDSPIHRLDPRAKILAVLAYTILLLSYPRYTLPAPWFIIFPAAILLWGYIPLRFVFKHILLVSPFIFCMVIFSILFDKTSVSVGQRVVPGGWLTAASVLARFALGMAALIGLVSTTRFADLLKGLEKLRVPHLLVSQLRFLYRYLFLLIDQTMHLRQARRARDAGFGPRGQRWRSSAGMIGTLFVRTLDQAERTHLAMLARGYDGTIHLAQPLRWRRADSLFIVVILVYLVFARWGW